MKNIISVVAAMALSSSLSGAVTLRMEAVTSQEALVYFDDFCVANYLDRDVLIAKLQSDKVPWTRHSARRPSDVHGGAYFESKRGEIGHVSQADLPSFVNDPACHFTFIADGNTSHDALVALAETKFGLADRQDTSSSKTGKQARWDYQNVGKAPARIFVSSGLKANGRIVSRLSISRHRSPAPKPLGKTN